MTRPYLNVKYWEVALLAELLIEETDKIIGLFIQQKSCISLSSGSGSVMNIAAHCSM